MSNGQYTIKDCIGKIKKEGGHIDELPIEVKKSIHDLIMSIDLDNADKMTAEGNYGMYQSDEVPGISVVVGDKKIVALVKMGVYDLETRSINDEMVMAVGIPMNDIKRFLEE